MPHAPRRFQPIPTVPQRRPSAAKSGYGYRWRQARLAYLREHPLCVQCAGQGLIVAAVVVDHIRPHLGDQRLFWNTDNWRALCRACHSRKTAQQDGGFGNPVQSRPVGGIN